MDANNEGIYLDMRKYFIYVVHIKLTLRGHGAQRRYEDIINEICLK
jgi:hypothetical protein